MIISFQISEALKSSGTVTETGKLASSYKEKAMQALSVFPKSEAHDALLKILNAAST